MNIEDCPHCRTSVVPKPEGSCPNCGFNVHRRLTVEEEAGKNFAEQDLKRACQGEIANNELGRGLVLLFVGMAFIGATYNLA